MSINQAHLIHDASGGRSSTRLHAPPGGKSSMGTSFSWAEEAPAPRQLNRRDPNASSIFGGDEAPRSNRVMPPNKKEFVDNRIGAGISQNGSNENNNAPQQQHNQQQQQQMQQKPHAGDVGSTGSRVGFGDTGASSVRVHHAPGGASSGNFIGGWN
eukprot:CAMPEP_0173416414 /NCGR_PEP_ID=MMETSP1356-20130122/85379_1 /TAXON_ID=77927 ORGANISM="Hemiselmis virescens, Strain PCC157" /NCGR_SAMPLE_ID=MMETSP1356 /ASSEMBLY_ACC=CAM_ASM_000847 /LENGTH=155 /DNA_ID=CAMNT_0014378721 /DNA_START=457 /DNA_END=924 /DNA_ORIENTATION=-